jgi:anaerobic magnesium-protoporphyrin IX monomethyl ester cyclase
MKILLLNPPFKTEYGRFSRDSRSPAITKSGTIYYPIWLSYIAGVLEEAGFNIKLIDSCAYEYNKEKTLEIVKDFNPDLCVLNTSTPSIYEDANIGAIIKNILPNSFIILIGTHPTALPEETLNLNNKIDAIAVGEADYIIKDLSTVLSESDLGQLRNDMSYREKALSGVDGLAYRIGKDIKRNKQRPLIADLDKIPFVSKIYKEFLDSKKYFFAASDYPEVQIMTSRGCMAKCTFCLYPQVMHRLKYRMRSVGNVVDEFEWITKNMPEIKEIGIEDDTFTGDQERAIDICKEIIKRNIKIKWYCNVRVDIKYETMEWIKKAGCVLVTVGYESADKKILERIKKGITPEMISEFSKNCKKVGLLVHSCFMAGNIGETKESLERSLNFSLKILDDTMQFFPLIVYPGTSDFETAKNEGLLTFNNYSDYLTEDGNHNSTIRTRDMTSGEIKEWCNYARRKYYLRGRYLFYKLFQQITNPSEIRRTLKAGKRFIKFLFSK